jgi:hypothetical protein
MVDKCPACNSTRYKKNMDTQDYFCFRCNYVHSISPIQLGGFEKEIKFNGNYVGKVMGDTFYTRRNSKHLMRKFNGYGVSKDILLKVQGMGVKNIQIKTDERILNFPIEKYLNSIHTHTYNGRLSDFKDDIQMFVNQNDGIHNTKIN